MKIKKPLLKKDKPLFFEKNLNLFTEDKWGEDLPIQPMFDYFNCEEDYVKSGVKAIEPMLAKELSTEEEQDEKFNDPDYIVEEKFDGVRGILQFFSRVKLEKALKITAPQSDEDFEYYVFLFSLLKGSNIVQGNYRIYTEIKSDKPKKDKVDFLKKEFGIGGGTFICKDFFESDRAKSCFRDFNKSGYKVNLIYSNGKEVENCYSWSQVLSAYEYLISERVFYPQEGYSRLFSRRISKKTGFYSENTDLVPQIRDINVPSMNGTIIDGELFIPNKPFKEVSSIMNCLWDKAVKRQISQGLVVMHAFDILFYKGIDLRQMPLHRRKVYLKLAIEEINSPYVLMVDYFQSKVQLKGVLDFSLLTESKYPTLYKEVQECKNNLPKPLTFSPKAYYEYIVMNGGEGVILKPKNGKYYHKRCWEYSKVKKFLTREAIILGFTPPTEEYKGKFPTIEQWDYWETMYNDVIDLSTFSDEERKLFKDNYYPNKCAPVSKYYAKNWVGNIIFGVVITDEEIEKLPKNKKFDIVTIGEHKVVTIGECSGFDEEQRKTFSQDPDSWIGTVIEVKANEIFKDTGKLRHPRFLRLRPDKGYEQCTWKDHIL